MTNNTTASAIEKLKLFNPWPATRPEINDDYVSKGWLSFYSRMMLGTHIRPDFKLIVELGAWRGMSSRFIADSAPQATVVAIDHWEGSEEHKQFSAQSDKLQDLMDMFFHDSWEFRDRIIPLKAKSVDGLQILADLGLKPDLIYIDADHSFQGAYADITSALRLFPEAVLIGDDFDWPEVRQAAVQAAHENDAGIEYVGVPVCAAWRFVRNQPTSPV